jgi:4'-phosphopantetheinyl transferase
MALIPETEVHLWLGRSMVLDSIYPLLESTLSSDEFAKANRFRFSQDRKQYVTARGFMRTVLGAYLDREPSLLKFNYSPEGKPSVQDHKINFNISHTDGIVLLGVTSQRLIGVDVEAVRPLSEFELMEQRVLSVRERGHLSKLAPDQRLRAFYGAWTCKEAYLKAIGRGLGEPMNAIEIDLIPDSDPALVSAPLCNFPAAQWKFRFVPVSAEYVAAAVVQEPDCEFILISDTDTMNKYGVVIPTPL